MKRINFLVVLTLYVLLIYLIIDFGKLYQTAMGAYLETKNNSVVRVLAGGRP